MKFKLIIFASILFYFNSFSAPSQNDVVISTIYGEARGEGYNGQLAVYNVIRNRAIKQHKTLKEICLSKYQFSFWNGRNVEKTIKSIKNTQNWLKISKMVENAPKYDNTFGALYYFNYHVCNPSWARRMKETALIGNHVFFKP